MTGNPIPIKTRQLAATLYENFRATTVTNTAETTTQAAATAQQAARDFFTGRDPSREKLDSVFKKAAELDPAELTDPAEHKKFVRFLQSAIPQARAWAPPPCPVIATPPLGPMPIEIETAKIAPVIPDDVKVMYFRLNRALVNACRQNPSEQFVQVKSLLVAAGVVPQSLCYYKIGQPSPDGEPLEKLFADPDDEEGELLACLHELKHWLLNCGATQVHIAGRRTIELESSTSGTEVPPGMRRISVTDFDISLQAPPADKLTLLPLQLSTQRLAHQMQNLDLE